MRVIVASPVWSLNGVNVFAANLVRGLNAAGAEAHLLLTWPEMPDPKPMPLPADLPVARLPVAADASWSVRWRAMIGYLEAHAPCVYLPNYDFWHSCVCPVLPRSVAVVGIVHSDDPQHYEHVSRLGRYWDAIVAVSPAIATQVTAAHPDLASRLTVIPYGVEAPEQPPVRQADQGAALNVVYHGVLKQSQKRILDLPRIIEILHEWGVPVRLTLVGAGPEQAELQAAAQGLITGGELRLLPTLPHAAIPPILAESDVFILTSEFEGLPHALLEAMAWGCVPVVTDIRSGIPELIRDGVNGCRVAVGDLHGFAERLALLQRDPVLKVRLSREAARSVREGGYRLQEMTDRYITLLGRVLGAAKVGAYRRPRGRMAPPLWLPWTGYLPAPVRRITRRFWGRKE